MGGIADVRSLKEWFASGDAYWVTDGTWRDWWGNPAPVPAYCRSGYVEVSRFVTSRQTAADDCDPHCATWTNTWFTKLCVKNN